MMIHRKAEFELRERLDQVPAVVLTGPRQSGKTTLALSIRDERDAVYLDLESPSVQNRLSDPELYLQQFLDRTVILDEVHRVPDLFPILRVLIDRRRRDGP